MKTYNIEEKLIPSEQLWNSLTPEQREAVFDIANHRARCDRGRLRQTLQLDYRAWRAEMDTIRYESSDERLVVQFLGGDETAFGELQERRLDELAVFLKRRVGGDRNLAYDVAEQTFTLARKHIASFDPTKAKFRTWLFFSALHRVEQPA